MKYMQAKYNIKISIIMGIYNCDKYLDKSIQSLLSQTYQNFEIIMCDDASDDNTYEIAKKYKNMYPNKIILLKNKMNMGLNYTLNKCIAYSNGEYIARQDGDDLSVKNRFEEEVKILNAHKEFAFVSTNAITFDENGEWGQTHLKEYPNNNDFLITSPFCHASSMIRKNVLNEVENYSEGKSYIRVEDYDLWFKIYSKGYKGYNIQAPLYMWRDDRDAYNRRKFKYRINEMKIKIKGFNAITIPWYKFFYVFRPILVGILPYKIYSILHRRNIKKVEDVYDKKIIKIAQFVGTMNCGGTETMLMNIYRNIDKKKYKFFFIENTNYSWYDEQIEKLGGKIIRIETLKKLGIFKYINQLINIFKKEKFDVVHSHVFLHSGFVMYAAKKAGVKIRIAHSHSDMSTIKTSFLGRIKKILLQKMILNNATKLLACSEGSGKYLFGEKAFLKNGKVLKNPINIFNIDYSNDSDFVKKYNVKSDTILLGSNK